MTTRHLRLCLAAGLAASCPVLAQSPEIIYTSVASAPQAKREVPGHAPLEFDSFFFMYGSPSGQYWTVKASTNDLLTQDDVVLFGSGTAAVVVVKEGTPTSEPGRNWGTFDNQIGINDAGTLAVASNLSDPTTDDETVSRFVLNGGVPTWDGFVYREGQPAPDAGVTPFIPAGATFGGDINDIALLADGTVCAQVQLAPLTGLIATTNDECLYKGGVALHRELTTSPNAWPNLWDAFSFVRYSADGARTVVDGDDDSLTDDITAVDNTVVIQQGQTIAGLTSPTDSTASDIVILSADGDDWFSMGSNTNLDEDWVVRNGAVIANAFSGPTNNITPANPGAEFWSDTDYAACFVFVAPNSRGDYALCGVTTAASNANAVVVVNGETVVSREGDPVDLDGNGQFDDNTYIRTYNDDSAFLTDDGWLYVRLTITDDPSLGNGGPDLGQAIVRMRVLEPSACYANCDSSTQAPILNVADFTCFLNRFAAGDSYANCDLSTQAPVLNVADFTCFLNRFAAGCP